MQSPAPWEGKLCAPVHAVGWPARKQLCREKDLGVLVDTMLTTSQQCTLTAKKANHPLGCARKHIAIRSRDVNLPLCSALVNSCLEWWEPSSQLQSTREIWTYWKEDRPPKDNEGTEASVIQGETEELRPYSLQRRKLRGGSYKRT